MRSFRIKAVSYGSHTTELSAEIIPADFWTFAQHALVTLGYNRDHAAEFCALARIDAERSGDEIPRIRIDLSPLP